MLIINSKRFKIMKSIFSILLILVISFMGCKQDSFDPEIKDDKLINLSPEFERYLIDAKIDTESKPDLMISYGKIKNIDSLHIYLEGNRNSLKGLEYFTNLKYLKFTGLQKSTDISNQYYYTPINGLIKEFIPAIDTLDVSKNINLEYLDCSGKSDGGGYYSSIGNLKFGKNTKLKTVISKFSMMASLDLSQLTALEELDIVECYNLPVVSLCKNKKLTKLRSWQVKQFYISSKSLIKTDWVVGAAIYSECE